jgi:CubicO group peptidase (beta-lactamase class C family)
MILAGALVESLTGMSFDKAAYRYVIQPLGLKSTSFIDLSMIRRRGIQPVTDMIAPTEECPWRKRVLCGEVHDDNAWAMGGVAGHAGIFSTANDLHLIARTLLAAYHGRSQFLSRETVQQFLAGPAEPERAIWKFGRLYGMLGVDRA